MDPRAIVVSFADVVERSGGFAVWANGEPLTTPAGNPVEVRSEALARALVAELTEDQIADVTRPCMFAFLSAQRDFIEPDPDRTVDALVELLAHDFLLHPDERLGRRQVQIAAWTAQIDLWRRVAGQDPPVATADADPEISQSAYTMFHDHLHGLSAAQLSVAIHATNILKSVTLGILLAEQAVAEDAALEAVAVTPRFLAGEMQEDLEREQEQEEEWLEAIRRLLSYAKLSARGGSTAAEGGRSAPTP
jgi:chaperone required for assembly of F1-ATPase